MNKSFLVTALTLIAVITLLSISYLYYKNIQFEEKNKQASSNERIISELLTENRARCFSDSQQFYDMQKKNEQRGLNSYNVSDSFKFIYSTELKTCLVYWTDTQFYENDSTVFSQRITDIYTNDYVQEWVKVMPKNGKIEETKDKWGSYESFSKALKYHGFNGFL